ncbi:hypothetical protein SAMN05518683_108133 [Salibacterium halotolerans]|uniref:Uncharacterized protein n=1 Tax=Salibacterium halotolerans TaxID=1884432 RepID=A0A1I5SDT4_9BACI|nr:hypothetical protein SAMN05518683_108133 [Salibacterium halotolerans]
MFFIYEGHLNASILLSRTCFGVDPKKLFSLFFVAIIIAVSVSSQSAIAETNQSKVANSSKKEAEQINKEAEQIKPYINSKGTFVEFNKEEAIKNGVNKNLAEKTADDIKKINQEIRDNQNKIMRSVTPNCRGVTKVNDNWFDNVIYLDSCKAQTLENALQAGATASTLSAILPHMTIPGSIAAGFLSVGEIAVSSANNGNTGIRIRTSNSGDLYWIHSQ